MLILLSPSKAMESRKSLVYPHSTEVIYMHKARQLATQLKKYDINALAVLLNVSQKIAQQTYKRYQLFGIETESTKYGHALLSYSGDVYKALEAGNFTYEESEYAKHHLRILSGLYGYLNPFDLIQPYRLEMATGLPIGNTTGLYSFWGKEINKALQKDIKQQKTDIINLASSEYFKIIDLKSIDCKIITPTFLDEVNGKLKIVSIYAKKARGLMTSFIIKNKLKNTEYLKAFNEEGYHYNIRLSGLLNPTFTR
jgi:cytoplasmic iron level regulating protein YaaA (DUF328/UPF0246 family)